MQATSKSYIIINMNEPIFSEREEVAPRKDLQEQDYLPGWVREAITNEIREFTYKDAPLPGVERLDIYPLFKPYIWKVLDREPPISSSRRLSFLS